MMRNLILSSFLLAPVYVLGFSSTSHAQSSGEGEGEGEGAAGEGEGEGAVAGEGEGEGAAAGEGEGEGAAAGEGEGEGVAGEGEGEGQCGGLTLTGDCNGKDANGNVTGNVVEFCAQGQIGTEDCSGPAFTAANVTATCGEATPEWGVDCHVAQASACILTDNTDPQNPTQITAFCDGGANAACSVSAISQGSITSACVNNSSACSAADAGTCDGNRYVFSCGFVIDQTSTDGQRTLIDCDQVGGTCQPDSTPGAGDGGCNPGTGEGEGEGTAVGEGEGAAGGEGEGAAGEGEGEGSAGGGGCGCNTSSRGDAAGFAAIALLGGVLLNARRRRS